LFQGKVAFSGKQTLSFCRLNRRHAVTAGPVDVDGDGQSGVMKFWKPGELVPGEGGRVFSFSVTLRRGSENLEFWNPAGPFAGGDRITVSRCPWMVSLYVCFRVDC